MAPSHIHAVHVSNLPLAVTPADLDAFLHSTANHVRLRSIHLWSPPHSRIHAGLERETHMLVVCANVAAAKKLVELDRVLRYARGSVSRPLRLKKVSKRDLVARPVDLLPQLIPSRRKRKTSGVPPTPAPSPSPVRIPPSPSYNRVTPVQEAHPVLQPSYQLRSPSPPIWGVNAPESPFFRIESPASVPGSIPSTGDSWRPVTPQSSNASPSEVTTVSSLITLKSESPIPTPASLPLVFPPPRSPDTLSFSWDPADSLPASCVVREEDCLRYPGGGYPLPPPPFVWKELGATFPSPAFMV